MKMPRVLVTASIVGCLLVSPASLSSQPPARFQLKLTPEDGAAGDKLACAVAVEGDTLVAGSFVNDRGTDSGAVYLYQLEDGAWLPQDKVSGLDTEAGDLFGYSVSTASNRALVGAPLHDDGGEDTGAAYTFVVGNGRLRPEDELTASDAAPGDAFGSAVATDGARAAIGAPGRDRGDLDAGAVYVFQRGPNGWSQQAILEPGDPGPGDRFGRSLALDGELVAVGAPYDDDRGTDSGSVYVFRRRGAGWLQEAKLVPGDASPFDAFGYAVATDGQRIFVGAPRHGRAGAAYVYRSTRNGWTLETRLDPPQGAEGDQFGVSVANDSERVLVGSRLADDAARHAGAVSLFRLTDDRWTEVDRLVAGDAAPGDELGLGIALSGLTVVAGAYLDDTGPLKNTGAIYLQAPEADLFVELTSAPSEAGGRPCRQARGIVGSGELVPGCGVRYTLKVLNAGPDEVTGMKVRFPVTQGARAARGSGSVTLTGVAWSCSMEGGRCGKDSGRGDLNESVDLPPGTPLTYTVTARIPPEARGTLARSASLGIPDGVLDPTPAEPTAADTAPLIPVAEVSLELNRSFDPADPKPGCVKAAALVNAGEAVPGCTVVYALEVDNEGPSRVDRTLVQLEDSTGLLSDLTWTCTATRGKCKKRGRGNVQDHVVLPRRGHLTYSWRGNLPPAALGTLDVSASVTLPENVLDPTKGDQSIPESATLRPVVTLANELKIVDLSATGRPGCPVAPPDVPGCPASRELTITNQGPSAVAANVCFGLQVDPDPEDTAPPVCQEANAARGKTTLAERGLEDLVWTCNASPGAGCSDGQGNVDDAATLPVNGEVTYRLQATVDGLARGALRTTTFVKTPEGVPDLGTGPIEPLTLSLLPLADVRPTLTLLPSPLGFLAYSIDLTNDGPSDLGEEADQLRLSFNLTPAFSENGESPDTGTWTCAPTSTPPTSDTRCTPDGSGDIADSDVLLPADSTITYELTGAKVFDPGLLVIENRVCVSVFQEETSSPPQVSGVLGVDGDFRVGGKVFYTVVLYNELGRTQFNNLALGGEPGDEVVIELPSQLSSVEATCREDNPACKCHDCALHVDHSTATETVTWNGSICPNGRVEFSIEATIDPEGATAGMTLTTLGHIHYDTEGNGTNEETLDISAEFQVQQ